jgi:hypothetical protein
MPLIAERQKNHSIQPGWRNDNYSNLFMKIRIQGNSIRYRLRQPEVENFKKYGSVTEVIRLGKASTDQLRFILQRSTCNEMRVQFENATTIIHVPQPMADTWTDSDLVGFDAIVEIDNGLKVLVEKDFKCLDGSDEDNVGAYPNPAKQC